MVDRIQEGFENFHQNNPEVYRLFNQFTHKMISRGFQHGSTSLIAERIRWETSVETEGEMVKLNNNYRSRYSRLWEKNNSSHAGFFRKRVLRSHSLNAADFDGEDLV